jgi:broad specificity phosphatase PhoE
MMTALPRILLVRHAEPVHFARATGSEWNDRPLSDKGIHAAEELAVTLASGRDRNDVEIPGVSDDFLTSRRKFEKRSVGRDSKNRPRVRALLRLTGFGVRACR